MPRSPLTALATRGTLVAIFVAAALLLGGLFAVEAVRVSRSHEVSVGRFLDESAQAAAREFLGRSRDELDAVAAELFAGLTDQRAPSPYETAPGVERLQRDAARRFSCSEPVRAFRYDFRSDSLTLGADATPVERAALAALIRGDYRARYRSSWRATLLTAGGASRPIVYGVRFAEYQAPLAAYGVQLCTAALRTAVFDRARQGRTLLAVDAGAQSPDSLLTVEVRDAAGGVLLPAAATSDAVHRATTTIERLGGVAATVTLFPAATRLLAVSPPSSSRVVLLVALFVLTALLSLLALLQLRRESALVRLRTDFTSSVSHELRTPLSQILLFGETLRLGRARTPDEQRLAVETIVEEGRRLMHLVDNLLQFDRASRGAPPLPVAPVRVAEVVQSACDAFNALAQASQMTVTCRVPAALAVRADAAALRHVLLNFLDNAAKYGPSPQDVRLSADRVGDAVRISVDDQGPGIPRDEREHIWAPFARLDRDRRGTRPGGGIGLSVARDLTLRQGGTCRVEDAEGGGARFVVELPAAEEMP